jgi:hypothetical protein
LAEQGDPRFHKLLSLLGQIHDAKSADYGSDDDPFANFQEATEFGVKPWIAAALRANDKMVRVRQFAKRGILINEGVEDSFIDLAVCSLIALILLREEKEKPFTWRVEENQCGKLDRDGGMPWKVCILSLGHKGPHRDEKNEVWE